MGHKFIISFSLPLFLWAASPYPDIDALIEKIKVQRKGLNKEEIAKLKDPFITQKRIIHLAKIQKVKKKTVVYHFYLNAIFDKRARINGRWYKVGSKIGPYKLITIRENHVTLVGQKRTITLFLRPYKSKRLKLIPLNGVKK